MSDIYSRMTGYITGHSMIGNGESILAAVSGGADSMCMLDLLIRYAGENGHRIGAVNIDHGFRPEAKDEAAYVRDFCYLRNIPFYHEKIEPGSISSSEESARIRRYELISGIADREGYDRIALAHNMQDRAETLLFNIFRGSGIRGLCGIRSVRDRFIRPVMCLSRDEIESYLGEQGIDFYTDSTNLSDTYSRNRIRHNIIPEAMAINEGSLRHMNRLCDDISDICDLLDDEVRKAYGKCVTADPRSGETKIDISEYLKLNRVIRTGILRSVIFNMTPHLKDITREHIECIDELFNKETGSRADLPYGIRAYKDKDAVSIGSKVSPEPDSFIPVKIDLSFPEFGEQVLKVPLRPGAELVFELFEADRDTEDISGAFSGQTADTVSVCSMTKIFDYDKINKFIDLRFPESGDRITIDAGGHTKPLNRYMIEAKIPRRLREKLPVLSDGHDVIWIPGYRDSYAYRISEDTGRVLKIRLEEKDG